MNNENQEFLSTITKEKAIEFGARILYLSYDKKYQPLYESKPLLQNITNLSKLVLEKPLTFRSRSIRDLVQMAEFSADEFKLFYFNLITKLNDFEGLIAGCKLYPSNIEVSVIIPYLDSLTDNNDILNAYEILEGECWWYSNHQKSKPKGLLRLMEIHPKENLTKEKGDTISVENIPFTAVPQSEIDSITSHMTETVATSATVIETDSVELELTDDVQVSTLEQAESEVATLNKTIDVAQPELSQSDLAVKIIKTTQKTWERNDSFTYQDFTATESFITLTEPSQTIYPLREVVKEVTVTTKESETILLKAQYILRDVALENKDAHLAIYVFKPQTDLVDIDLKYALGSAIGLLHNKAKSLKLPLVVDEAYNIIIKNKPKQLSLPAIQRIDNDEILFPGIEGKFVYATK